MLKALAVALPCLALLACASDENDATDTQTVADTATADVVADAPDAADDGSEELVVMTYNIMCSLCTYSDHPSWEYEWEARLPWLHDTIARHDPDLIGVQELSDIPGGGTNEVATLGGDDGEYEAVYYHRQPDDTWPYDYPDAVVYYRASRFDLLDQGSFWLSPTPDVPFSHGFKDGPSLTRLVVWATLHDRRTGRDITVGSTHFDNNQPNQPMSAPITLERFAPMAAERPVIFVGDFNSRPNSEAYGILAEGVDGEGFHFDNAYDLDPDGFSVDPVETDWTTTDWSPDDRIDHIWLAGHAFTVLDWTIDLHAYGELDQAASDHYAVTATIRL